MDDQKTCRDNTTTWRILLRTCNIIWIAITYMTKLYLMYIYICGYSSISSPTCRCSCVDYVRYTSKAKERKKERKKVNLPVTIFIFNSATEICFWNKKNIVETYTLTWRILWGQIKPKFFQKKTKNRFWLFIVHLNASERNDSYTQSVGINMARF